uniref:Uncharacterized protein AlNc14C201G8698 n=1 Tax=Albugo laibachii Nc14 TaxID=890382 RepID=F0WQN7_9STRA|nr:conserved hypothetical protein [Albugo laibachii Nc14]|eukprot:CCA23646.1 conserved hypothetical protein [Albugo laibachii Nc14]
MPRLRCVPSAFHASLSALTALSCSYTLPALSEAAEEPSNKEENVSTSKQTNTEFFGFFPARESVAALKKAFPRVNEKAEEEKLFSAVKLNPSVEEKEVFSPLFGEKAVAHVKAFVEDANAQAILVDLKTENGEPIPLNSVAPESLHVPLTSALGFHNYNIGYTNVLMERLQAAGLIERLFDTNMNELSEKLEAYDSKKLSLFNPFPATDVHLYRQQDPLQVKGTFCMSSDYDAENETCTRQGKAECGFCKFMRAGPCGTEFTAWEKCLDECKMKGEDFIEKCGKETLDMRDCIERHPEYYRILDDSDEQSPDSDDIVEKNES